MNRTKLKVHEILFPMSILSSNSEDVENFRCCCYLPGPTCDDNLILTAPVWFSSFKLSARKWYCIEFTVIWVVPLSSQVILHFLIARSLIRSVLHCERTTICACKCQFIESIFLWWTYVETCWWSSEIRVRLFNSFTSPVTSFSFSRFINLHADPKSEFSWVTQN